MKVPCPGCGTMLEVTDSGCQLCLRGRSKGEILRDIQKFKAAEKAAKQRPWKILGSILLLSGIGYLVWANKARLSAATASVRAKASRFADDAMNPGRLVKPPPPAPPTQAPEPSAPSAPAAAVAAAPASTPDATASRAPAPAEDAPAQTWELPPTDMSGDAGSWLVRGFVYDLARVRPIPGAEVVYRERVDGTITRTIADASGYYHVRVNKRSDYLVEVRAQGFRAAPLEESDPPYRAQSKTARAKAISEAQGYTSDSALISWNENIEDVRQDLVLVPSR